MIAGSICCSRALLRIPIDSLATRIEITNKPQSKSPRQYCNSIIRDNRWILAQNHRILSVSVPRSKSEGSKHPIILVIPEICPKTTVTRYEGKRSEHSNVDSAVAKTEETDTSKNRSSQSDGQRSDNRDQTIKLRSQDEIRTPSMIASRTDNLDKGRRSVDPESLGRESDNRWSRLRSKVTAQNDFDMHSRDGRSDRDGHTRGR